MDRGAGDMTWAAVEGCSFRLVRGTTKLWRHVRLDNGWMSLIPPHEEGIRKTCLWAIKAVIVAME